MPRRLANLAPVLLVLTALGPAGCASTWSKPVPISTPGDGGYQVRRLGERFLTEVGNCVLIKVQDEYRLIAETKSGGVSGMFEPVFSVSRDDIQWTEWVDVPGAPGLKIAFLSLDEIAVRYEAPRTDGR